MHLFRVTLKLLKRYPVIVGCVVSSIILSSLFEGASFGMLIPLVQGMTAGAASLSGKGRLMQWISSHFQLAGDTNVIVCLFIMLLALIALKNIFVYFSSIWIGRVRFGISRDLRVALMDKLIDYDLTYFDNAKVGHIINTLDSETRRMGDFMSAMLNFLALLIKICVYVALMFCISWQASIVIFALIVSVFIPLEFIMKRIKKIGTQLSGANARYNDKMFEILSGIRVIKSFVTEKIEKGKFKDSVRDVYTYHCKNNQYSSLIMPLSETVILMLVVGFFLAMIRVKSIDIARMFPFIATYLLVLVRMLGQINNLNARRSEAISNLAAFSQYDNISDPYGKKTIKSGDKDMGSFSHDIEFRGVSFSYTDGKEVLKYINFHINCGKTTAIVGASGAGKSTLINLILRFYGTSTGRIMVDGVDIKDIELNGWRKKTGLVSQDVFIFNATVKDNIAYACSASTIEDAVRAAKLANAHDFIMALPKQYDTVLGERGAKLSGGQKQRISIARAILHNPEILILDEATSSLDSETERLIKQAIDRLTINRTVIAIAHRLSTVARADTIVVLEGGRIVESGNHLSLIAHGGVYKRLYDAQFSTCT